MDMKSILAAALPFEEKVSISMTTLLTGFVVVFSVLLLLIFIIMLLGKIITAAQKKPEKKPEVIVDPVVTKSSSKPVSPDGIPEEIIAVIAAAVDSTFGAGKAKIVGIKKSRAAGGRPAWGQAGVINNTRPF